MNRSISSKEYQRRAEKLLKRIRQEVKPFADDTPAGKEKRRSRAKKDLVYLCQTYLPHYFQDPFEDGHDKINAGLKNWNRVVQVLGFRGLGKTTFVGTGYALQAVLFGMTKYLPIISDTEDQAALIMLPLKAELEENPRIKQDFGDMKGIEWNEDAFVTTGNVKVEAFSWRSFKRGRKHMQYRAKIAICDDIESLDSVKNRDQVDRRYNALMGDVVNGLDLRREWQMVVVCNRLARYDISHLLEENEQVISILVPAEKSNGRATHPKTFPKKVLNEIRKLIGSVRYAREYLLTIISGKNDDFREEWFVEIDHLADYKLIVTAKDPSVGSTEGHDPKAIITVGVTRDNHYIDVIHAWIRRTTIHSMCKQSFEVNRRMKPHKFLIESNNFQVLLKDKLKTMADAEPAGWDLMSKIKQVVNKMAKNTRILRLQAPIENGTLRFYKNGGDMQKLKDQLLDFNSDSTNNEDDGPDALEMAVNELKRLTGDTSEVEVTLL